MKADLHAGHPERDRIRGARTSLNRGTCIFFLLTAALWAQQPKSATIKTTAGDFRCQLFPDKAPNAVANFVGLAEGTKDWTDPDTKALKHGVRYYDGVIFHRVIPNFMIQGGDPTGTGSGDPGYSFKDENAPDLKFDIAGRLAYANSGPDT